jgi:predicted DNA-binding transcriptional regulator YafY
MDYLPDDDYDDTITELEEYEADDKESRKGSKMLPFYILSIIAKKPQGKKGYSRAQITEELEWRYGIKVDPNTVGRHLDDLMTFTRLDTDYGILKSEPGPFGKRTNYHLEGDAEGKRFTDGELATLISLVKFDRAIAGELSDTLVKKLEALGSHGFSSNIGLLDESERASDQDKVNLFQTVDKLRAAIRNRQMISFVYNEYGIDKKLHPVTGIVEFEPYHILPSHGRFYILGRVFGEDKLKHFRLDKIRELVLLRKSIGTLPMENIKEYIDAHPYMNEGHKASVSIKSGAEHIGEIIDEFGTGVKIEEYADEFNTEEQLYKISFRANEEDVFRWVLMRSDRFELLSPQALRARLRMLSADMRDRYLSTDSDFYFAEVDKIRRAGEHQALRREFSCPNIDLSARQEYHTLNVSRLCLKNNNVSDISFIRGYKCLYSFHTSGNPIKDFTPLTDMPRLQAMHIISTKLDNYDFIKDCKLLRKLTLGKNKVKNPEGLYTPLGLDYLVVYTDTDIDIERFKALNPRCEVLVGMHNVSNSKYYIDPTYPIDKHFCAMPYPKNLLYEIYGGHIKRFIRGEELIRFDKDAIESAKIRAICDASLAGIDKEKAEVITMLMQEDMDFRDAAKRLSVSIQSVIDTFEDATIELYHSQMRDIIRTYYTNQDLNLPLSELDAEAKKRIELRKKAREIKSMRRRYS